MINTKDLCFIICLAVLHFVVTITVGQIARMITGIPGTSYLFTIIHAIITSFSLLIYEGRRWRFFIQISLFTILITPTPIGGIPFDILSKTNMVINAFVIDLILNSVYPVFKKTDRILWWGVLVSVTFWLLNPFFGIIIKNILLFPPDYIARFINVVFLLFPVIIAEAAIGGWMGYKIFKRLKVDLNLPAFKT
ncbi:MAG: hypothetical protein NWF03_08515 [Candidatus Bathyarchaeota archaeon]|nr:hypothetical protein [Candidatus Bathyarchaeota archaeon]